MKAHIGTWASSNLYEQSNEKRETRSQPSSWRGYEKFGEECRSHDQGPQHVGSVTAQVLHASLY